MIDLGEEESTRCWDCGNWIEALSGDIATYLCLTCRKKRLPHPEQPKPLDRAMKELESSDIFSRKAARGNKY